MIEQFGNSPPSSSGAVITNRPEFTRMEKRFPDWNKTLIATSRKSRGYACRRYLPHCASFFRRGGALLGGMVFRYRTRSACPGQNGYHYRVRCTGPSRLSTLKPLSRHHICGLKRPPPTTPAGRSGNTIIFSRSRPLSLPASRAAITLNR